MTSEEYFDIFVSYKSRNATTVRHVVEQLIANDLKPWFAEYQLLFEDQLKILNADEFTRDFLIRKAIHDGINKSNYGLAFTNNSYARSIYCQDELNNLFYKLGPNRVIEVMIPKENEPHQVFENLRLSPNIIYSGNINDILLFIERQMNYSFKYKSYYSTKKSVAQSKIFQGKCLGRPYTIDISGWELIDEGGISIGPASEKGPDLVRCDDQDFLKMNLFFGKEFDPIAITNRLQYDPDNRDMYNKLMAYAKDHISYIRALPRGVHLFFHSGFSHIALTYRLKNIWIRKYSIILQNRITSELAEFVFTFGSFNPNFKIFCQYAHLMDQLVESLQWY